MMINKEHERIDEQKRLEESPETKSNKKQKIQHPTTTTSPTANVTDKPNLVVIKKCPNCGQVIEAGEYSVCAHQDCESLQFHNKCVNSVADKTWCRRHTPKDNIPV